MWIQYVQIKQFKCLNDGRPPHYDYIDAQSSHFIDWRKQNVNGSRWKVGIKLECLDPLNQVYEKKNYNSFEFSAF